jgi:hypothetical protein
MSSGVKLTVCMTSTTVPIFATTFAFVARCTFLVVSGFFGRRGTSFTYRIGVRIVSEVFKVLELKDDRVRDLFTLRNRREQERE